FALSLAVQQLLWGAFSPLFGGFADKFGPGRILALGGFLYAAGLALMAFSTDPLSFTLTAGLMVGTAQAAAGMSIALGAVGRMVPEERRSWAFGIVTMGSSAGMLVILPIGQAFLEVFGWSMGFVAMACLALVMIPLAFPLSGKPAGPTVGAIANLTVGQALREAFRHRSYLLLVAGFFVCGFHVSFIGTHLPAYVTDLGLPPETGAGALMTIGVVNIFGAYIAGILGGRYSKALMLSGMYLARAVFIAAMLFAPPTQLTIYLFAAAMGLFWLSTVPLTSGLVAVMFGTQYMTMLFGFVFFSHQVGSFLGVYLGGLLFDQTGSYEVVWWIGAALGVAAALIHLPIRETPVARPLPAE
ncbi:MAG TPA: MFS transporter, partial [Alphaproteobacteria bacterium]|nr:MFS transporter [Alphaproteobacteria bacterium]